MLPRKQSLTQFAKHKDTQFTNNRSFTLTYTLFIFVVLITWLLYLVSWSPTTPSTNTATVVKSSVNTCPDGNLVYIYDLPSEFNLGMLDHCEKLNVYSNMCPHVANRGLGQPLIGSSSSWFATNQLLAEMIFHARLENHACRTWDPLQASLFYVPFYGGLHASSKSREFNLTARDELAVRLADFLLKQPWWKRNSGKDHFLSLGRTAWDFMRDESGPDFGANILLKLPRVQNMSFLIIERQPWTGKNQIGFPYPSYFHPSTATEMLTWQDKMRSTERRYLFSFIGAPRKGIEKAAVREEIFKQCAESTRCELVKCGHGASKCHEPFEVLRVMTRSHFCLQAAGDSFTRRSTFDSIVAGCVPVFFSKHTAYTQYVWYLPEDPTSYSVYIDSDDVTMKKKSIEEVLLNIPEDAVKRMKEKVVELIPRITYGHPNSTDLGFRDAVDVAISEMGRLVQRELLAVS